MCTVLVMAYSQGVPLQQKVWTALILEDPEKYWGA
jgi:hypothetical protein